MMQAIRSFIAIIVCMSLFAQNSSAANHDAEEGTRLTCLQGYRNKTECLTDCRCGWCDDARACLTGGQDGYRNDSDNDGRVCKNATTWSYGNQCQSTNNVFFYALSAIPFCAGVAAAGYFLALQHQKKEPEYTLVPF